MRKLIVTAGLRTLRVLSLTVLAVVGTVALVRFAPGYFADARELDAQHAGGIRAEINEREASEGSFGRSSMHLFRGWARGDFGTSRLFDSPVSQLLRDRVGSTLGLLLKSVLLGWLLSFAIAFPLSSTRRRRSELLISMLSAASLCVPIALLATICLVLNWGGPVFVLATLIAIRDFKLLYRLLSTGMRSPAVVFARAQGYSSLRAAKAHLFRALQTEFFSLLTASVVVALSAIVPIEVIFDRPGLGQLAWSAAMNRDLPTLLPVTLLMAAIIGLVSVGTENDKAREMSACA